MNNKFNISKFLNKNILKFIKQNSKLYLEVKRRQIDLTLTENPLGCSPMVKKLFNQLPVNISSYPNGSLKNQLISAIAKKFKISRRSIALGNGAEALIDLICRVFINQGDKIIIPETTTFLFKRSVLLCGGQAILRPMNKDKSTNLETVKKALTTNPKLIFLANPNNPTGELIKGEKIFELVKKFKELFFVIDEANMDFTDEKESLIKMAEKVNNLIVIRTFSKAFGLAGLRIGFLFTNKKIVDVFNEVNQPFAVNSPALLAGIIALKDKKFLKKTKGFSQKQRIFLVKELTKLGFTVFNSESNNLLVKIPEKINPEIFLRELTEAEVSIIPGRFFKGLDNSLIRINIQNQKTNKKFIKILKRIVKAKK